MSGTTTTTEAEQLSDIIDRVKTWPLRMRIALAKHVLDTIEVPGAVQATRGRPVEELIGLGAGASTGDLQVWASGHHPPTTRGLSAKEVQGLLKTDRPPPDDETVDRWIDEHRMEKYG